MAAQQVFKIEYRVTGDETIRRSYLRAETAAKAIENLKAQYEVLRQRVSLIAIKSEAGDYVIDAEEKSPPKS